MPFNCFREAPIPENWPGAVLWGLEKVERRPGVRSSGLGGPRGRAGRRRSRHSINNFVVGGGVDNVQPHRLAVAQRGRHAKRCFVARRRDRASVRRLRVSAPRKKVMMLTSGSWMARKYRNMASLSRSNNVAAPPLEGLAEGLPWGGSSAPSARGSAIALGVHQCVSDASARVPNEGGRVSLSELKGEEMPNQPRANGFLVPPVGSSGTSYAGRSAPADFPDGGPNYGDRFFWVHAPSWARVSDL
mmetsp:Transcript_6902/g.21746  ORF Transcript_6902/g.21746 Transcript_6902/m.21746 type:complete len:245 (-) Transcript_6902:1801-2535(-)